MKMIPHQKLKVNIFRVKIVNEHRILCNMIIHVDMDIAEILSEDYGGHDYSPFPSKAKALMFMLINSPRPLVSLINMCV